MITYFNGTTSDTKTINRLIQRIHKGQNTQTVTLASNNPHVT